MTYLAHHHPRRWMKFAATLLCEAVRGLLILLFAWTPARAGQSRAAVTFAVDVAPILFARCATCHTPGGSAPFSLVTYESARQHARQIAEVTRRRVMPPWKIRPGSNSFVDKQPLTEHELAVLEEWAAAGAPEGDRTKTPPRPERHLLTDDLILPSEATYVLPPDGPDLFRTFVVRNPLRERRFVKRLSLRPSNPAAFHHADILLDRTPRSRRLVDANPGGGVLPRTATSPDGYLLGWSPGQTEGNLPGDLAWSLEPDTDFVVQLHLVPDGRRETIAFSLALGFADHEPKQVPVMLRLSRQDLEIGAGERDRVVTDSYVLPVAVDLLSVKPHAHLLARQVAGSAQLPDGTIQSLVAIDDWDFRWQQTYTYTQPLRLPKGTRLSMRISYDNSRDNPKSLLFDRAVHWGPNTSDEMGDLWLQVLPHSNDDADALVRDFRVKALSDNTTGYETLLRTGMETTGIVSDLAATYADLGQYDRALPYLTRLATDQPGSAAARYNLGVALGHVDRPAAAVDEYRNALALDPAFVPARFNLGLALQRLGRLEEAAKEYAAVLEIEPLNADAHNNIGSIQLELGHPLDAMAHFSAAMDRDVRSPDAPFNIGLALSAVGRQPEAQRFIERAVGLRPDWPEALLELASVMVNRTDLNPQAAARAVELARRAITLSGGMSARSADVLAGALAASGDYDSARSVLSRALEDHPADAERQHLADRLQRYSGSTHKE
jgi:tetratricopeptide (TPR) repeat protein